jgi:hypothetical protein
MQVGPPPGTPRWHWLVVALVVSALALLTIWLSNRTGHVVGQSCATEGLNQPVCHELRERNEAVFLAGMGAIVVAVAGYRLAIGRSYGGDTENR